MRHVVLMGKVWRLSDDIIGTSRAIWYCGVYLKPRWVAFLARKYEYCTPPHEIPLQSTVLVKSKLIRVR